MWRPSPTSRKGTSSFASWPSPSFRWELLNLVSHIAPVWLQWVSRNWGWTTLLYLVRGAEEIFPGLKVETTKLKTKNNPCMQEFTHLEKGDQGHKGPDNKASHAVSELITVMGHSGFSLLLWALSGFVDRHGAHVEGQDEFYQDNTVEVWKSMQCWSRFSLEFPLKNLFPERWHLLVLVDDGRLLHHQRKPWRMIFLLQSLNNVAKLLDAVSCVVNATHWLLFLYWLLFLHEFPL